MLAEIITIGDEILIGQIVDTNSAFIGKELNKIGVEVYQITSVQDNKQHILDALEEARARVDIVLITGGLGPTKDDITKHTICEYFNDVLVQDDDVLHHVEALFAKYLKTPMSNLNVAQALVPSTATVLMNHFGTAPGMWFEKEDKVFVSMPGVPFEMKGLMETEVLPRLQQKFQRPFIIHTTILTHGVGESTLADRIEYWEDNLPSFIKLAYLPSLGKVRLRLSARGVDKKVLEDTVAIEIGKLQLIIGDCIVGYEDDESAEKRIGALLESHGKTLSVAESCTGGKIAASFTANSGASAYFMGGVVAYATQSKIDVLGVDQAIIKKHTVTSAEVAEAMALASKKRFKSDYAIATTGNTGPTKGEGHVEIGTVFIAIATPKQVLSKEFTFGNQRERTVGKAVNKALELLFNELMGI